MTERVVVVHDYLTQRGGPERVVLGLMRAFPDARLVTAVYDPHGTYPEFRDYRVDTLWLDKVRPLRRNPRRALPLLARAFAHHRITSADVVICSSSGWAHGVRTDAPKIVYCHTPPRWLHQPEDHVAAGTYLANSTTMAAHMERTYGIEADVVPPPVMIDPFAARESVEGIEPGFLLTVSRGGGCKRADAVVAAVEQLLPDERLVVVGALPAQRDGSPWSARVTGIAGVTDAQLRWLYANCSALLAVSDEDFGLTPLEANAFGRPAVCLRAGGYLDTLRPELTGVFVDDATPQSVATGVRRMRSTTFSSAAVRAHAARFAPEVFAHRIRTVAEEVRALAAPSRIGAAPVVAGRPA